MTPSVSVLLPVRDAQPYLIACIRCLQRQSLTDFEVLAVDDGSADGSGGLLDDWAAADARVRVVHQQAGGLVVALNAGLARCRGALVARMDADDLCHPRRLELQAGSFDDNPELDVVASRVTIFPRCKMSEGLRAYEAWLNGLCLHEDIIRERFVESPLAHPSVMLRRRVLQDAGGYRDAGWPEDHDLWLRLAAAGVRFGKRPETLLFWRDHGARLTRTDPRYQAERFLECKAEHLVPGPLAGRAPLIVWGAGRTGRRLTRHLAARGVRAAAFIDIDPRKIGRTVQGAPVYGPHDLHGLRQGEPGAVVLAAVAFPGARDLIRAFLDREGLVEGEGYWCAA